MSAAACKRRRKQMILDKRYKKKDPITAARKDAKRDAGEKARAGRAKK